MSGGAKIAAAKRRRTPSGKRVLRWGAVAVALVLSAAPSTLLLGFWRFNRLVRRDIEALFAQAPTTREGVVAEDMFRDLPEPVGRYLTYTGVVGKPLVNTVYLKQKGAIRPSADEPWIPLDAEEYYSVQPPGFVWNATIHRLLLNHTMRRGLLPLRRGREMYAGGKGHMLIKVGSLFTVVDDEGEEMDQGSLMRYLSDMMWFPTAFLGDNVSFEPVDQRSVRVTLTDHGRSVPARMYFDQDGRLTDFVGKRHRTVEWGYNLETWVTSIIQYGEFEGLKLPVRGKALWKLPAGDYEYVEVTITELEYNVGKQ